MNPERSIRKEMTRLYRKINLKIDEDCKAKKMDLGSLTDQICNKMGLPMPDLVESNNVAKEIVKNDLLEGKTPETVAAISIFIATQFSTTKISFERIAAYLKKKAGTLRNAY